MSSDDDDLPATMFLKPGEGRLVPMEDGSDWPADGIETETTRFVRRRYRAGDLVKADGRKVVATATAAPSDPPQPADLSPPPTPPDETAAPPASPKTPKK